MQVPAICDYCGEIFPSGIVVENSLNITFNNISVGPCPSCGQRGHVSDGVFNFIGNTIELLSGPERTIIELENLAKILKNAKINKSTYEEISNEIERKIPELSSFKDILPKTRNELYAFIAIILTIISIYLSQSNERNKIEVNNIINNIYKYSEEKDNIKKDNEKEIKSKKIGRNEPCICGSGKKYKKCCGGYI
jgi:hypothetical protein